MRVVLIVAGSLALVAVAAGLAAPLVTEAVTDRVLATLPDYEAGVDDADVAIFRGVTALEGVTIRRPGVEHPFLRVERLEIRPRLGALLRGDRIADLTVDGLVVNYVVGADPEHSQTAIDADWLRRQVERFPATVDTLTVRGAEVHYRDHAASPDVHVVVDALEVDGENLANLAGSDAPLFGAIRVRGRVEEQGTLTAEMAVDPYADVPRFTLDARVEGVPLAALDDLLRAYAKFDAERGTFSAVTRLEAEGGGYHGTVTPEVRDLEVLRADEPEDRKRPLRTAWEAVVGTAADAAEVVSPGRDEIQADVPISGTFGEQPPLVEVLELLPEAWFGALTRAVRVSGDAMNEAAEGAVETGAAAERERGDDRKQRRREKK